MEAQEVRHEGVGVGGQRHRAAPGQQRQRRGEAGERRARDGRSPYQHGRAQEQQTHDVHDEKRKPPARHGAGGLPALAQPVLERLEARRRIFLIRHPQCEINDQQQGGQRTDREEIARASPRLLALRPRIEREEFHRGEDDQQVVIDRQNVSLAKQHFEVFAQDGVHSSSAPASGTIAR